MTIGWWVGEKAWLATDVVTDVTDGFLVGEIAWLATDVTDGLLVGEKAINN